MHKQFLKSRIYCEWIFFIDFLEKSMFVILSLSNRLGKSHGVSKVNREALLYFPLRLPPALSGQAQVVPGPADWCSPCGASHSTIRSSPNYTARGRHHKDTRRLSEQTSRSLFNSSSSQPQRLNLTHLPFSEWRELKLKYSHKSEWSRCFVVPLFVVQATWN